MKGRILVVDDTADSLMILRRMLEAQNFVVSTASSGTQALERLRNERPDAILLDVMMPDMSGIEVLQRIRSSPKTAHVPVILVTAKTQDDDMIVGYQHGADYYITKPCTAKQLMYGLQMVLAKSEQSSGNGSGESDTVA